MAIPIGYNNLKAYRTYLGPWFLNKSIYKY